MRKFAVFFENGAWVVMERYDGGGAGQIQICPTLEAAIIHVAMLTGAPVGIELIARS